MTASTNRSRSTRLPRRLWARTRRPAVLVLTVLAALLAWCLLEPVAGVELRARTGATITSVGPGAVAVAALLASGAGWGLLALLERLLARPLRAWNVVAVLVLLASLPGALAGAGAAAVTGLMALHVVVGLTVIVGLSWGFGRRRGSEPRDDARPLR